LRRGFFSTVSAVVAAGLAASINAKSADILNHSLQLAGTRDGAVPLR
jgi:hypothetical protein